MDRCPSDDALLRFSEGLLDDAAIPALELHLDQCAECRTVAAIGGFDSTPAPARPLPSAGETLGRWTLHKRLGSGSGGLIFEARDRELQRDVALKVLFTADASDLERGLHEARAMARVVHPNVVTIYEVDNVEGQLVLAMELLGGDNLDAWSRSSRGWTEVIDAYIGAARGLAAAHDAGVVHGDFKPSNVLIGSNGAVRVADFGLSSFTAERGAIEPSGMSQIGRSVHDLDLGGGTTVSGTPAYMAPEQYEGHPADAITDLYAFCIALYRALYRQRPFEGDTPKQLAASRTEGAPSTPARSSVPRAIWPILRRGLQRKRADRYASMAPLIADLERIRRRRRRLALAAGGVAIVGLGFAAGATVVGRPAPCDSAVQAFDDVVSVGSLNAVRDALAVVDSDPNAAARFERRLAAYRSDWEAEFSATCGLKPTDGRPAGVVACLQRDLDRLHAVVTTFPSQGPNIVRIASAVDALPTPAHCREPDDWPLANGPEVVAVRRTLARAQALFHAGDFDGCMAELEQTRAAAEELDATRLRVEALNLFAAAALATSDFDGAHAANNEAIALLWGQRFPAAASQAAVVALELAMATNDVDSATKWGQRAMHSQALVKSRWKQAYNVAMAVGRSALQRGQPEAARERALAAVEICERESPDSDFHVRALDLLGNTWAAGGDAERAESILATAMEMASTSDDVSPMVTAVTLADLAQVNVVLGRGDKARPMLTTAFRQLKPFMGATDLALMSGRLARLEIAEGESEAALRRLDDALATLTTASAAQPLLHGLRGLALRKLERYGEAADAFAQEADGRRDEGSGSRGLAIALSNLGAALQSDGRCAEALDPLLRSAAMQAETKDSSPTSRWLAESHVAECLNDLGRGAQALGRLEPKLARAAEELPADHPLVPWLRFQLGRSMMATDPTGGLANINAARDTMAGLPRPDLVQEVDDYLDGAPRD